MAEDATVPRVLGGRDSAAPFLDGQAEAGFLSIHPSLQDQSWPGKVRGSEETKSKDLQFNVCVMYVCVQICFYKSHYARVMQTGSPFESRFENKGRFKMLLFVHNLVYFQSLLESIVSYIF